MLSGNSSASPISTQLLRKLVETLSGCFHVQYTRDESSKFATFRVFLGRVWWLSQMVSYLEPSTEEAGGSRQESFWLVLSCLRGDGVMAAFGKVEIWALLCGVLVGLCWGMLVILVIQTYLKVPGLKPIKSTFLLLSQILSKELLISGSNGLLGGLFPPRRLNAGWTSSIPSWCIHLLIPFYTAHLLLSVLTQLFTLEFDFYVTRNYGKDGISDELTTVVSVQLACISYYTIAPRIYVLHLGLLCALGLTATFRTAKRLPHYAPFMNLMKVWSRGAFTAASFALLVCEMFADRFSGLILALGLILSLVAILHMTFWTYEREKIDKAAKKIMVTSKVETLELGLRPTLQTAYFAENADLRLKSGQEALNALNRFSALFSNQSRTRVLLLKHFVWKHVFENGSGALICLTQAIEIEGKAIDWFLALKYYEVLVKHAKYEEIVYLRYLQLVEEVKFTDEKLCRTLGEIWGELASVQPNFTRLMKMSNVIRRDVRFIQEKFDFIVKNYPGGFELYSFFASFLREVLNEPDKSTIWRLKANVCLRDKKVTNHKDDSQNIDFFESSTAVILCDLRPSSYLSILYMNPYAASLLSYDAKIAYMSKLTGLIPPPYNSMHGKLIRNFVMAALQTNIDHPGFMPLITSKGFILFCVTRLTLTSFGGFSVILFAFRPMAALKDGAILNEKLIIEAHSESFPRMIGANEENLQGKYIADIRASLVRYLKTDGSSNCFQIFRNLPYMALFYPIPFSTKQVRYLFTFPTSMFHTETEYYRFRDAILHNYSHQDDFVMESNAIKMLITTEDNPSGDLGNQILNIKDTRRASFSFRTPFKRNSVSPTIIKTSASDSSVKKRFFSGHKHIINHSYKEALYTTIYTVIVTQILLLFALNIASIVIIKNQTESISQNQTIGDIAAKQIFIGQMAINARMIEQKIPLEARMVFRENLDFFTKSMIGMKRFIWSEITSSDNEKYERFMTDKNVKIWEMIDKNIRSKDITLVDAIDKLIEESEKVLSNNMDNIPHSAVFYLFRNGLGETYTALSESKEILVASQQENISMSIEIYYIYVLVAFMLLLFMTCISAFIMYRLETVAKGLSESLMDHPASFYYQEKHRVSERLQERYDFDVDFSLEQPFRGKRNNMKIYNPIVSYCLFLVGFWAICIAFYLYFYFEICMKLSNQMQTAPIVLNNDAIRLINVIEADMWLTEDCFGSQGVAMFEFVSKFGLIPSEIWKVSSVLSKIKSANKILLDKVLQGFSITSAHFDFLYNATNFTSPLFHQGFRVGNKAYLNDIMYYLSSDADVGQCVQLVNGLYNMSVELARNSYFVSGFYKEDCRVIVDRTLIELTAFMLSFSLVLFITFFIFHFFVNKPLHHVSRGLLKLASLMSSPKVTSKVTAKESTIDVTSTYK